MSKFILFSAVFVLLFFLPVPAPADSFLMAGVVMLHEYAREHVLTCLIPAFFIAGAITALLKKEAVLKYLGPRANKPVAYGVAAVSGSILAVCSCTILPLFAGIWKRGAGLGPAITLLYSGPAINIAAIFLTASVLGFQFGLARAVAAISLSIVIGLVMAFLFSKENQKSGEFVSESKTDLALGTAVIFIFLQILFLIVNGLQIEFGLKLLLFAILLAAVTYFAVFRLPRENTNEWLSETWEFSKMILPVLFAGVFIAGVAEFLLPGELVYSYVGGNGLFANLLASIFGAFMYFCTLTEVPIVQALTFKGMGSGPALALLLAGPSLSLPSMLVINRILGTKKTVAYVLLVILFSTAAGMVFGSLA
ncbi:MAG: permease [Candidatus Micrarchaeota archaeon]|nr:permease [Candidatus Micrarchaeota archaeon]